jgi:tetratricopeptide (TPR) repeat protein
MRNLFLFVLIFSLRFLQAQICDTMDVKQTKHLAKVYQEQKERMMEKKEVDITDGDLAFDIANYLRQKNDSTNRFWYSRALNLFNNDQHLKSDEKKAKRLYRYGLCYFYLGNYAEAETYLAKAIAAKYYNPCKYYFYSFSLKKQGKTPAAEEQFKLFEAERPKQRIE